MGGADVSKTLFLVMLSAFVIPLGLGAFVWFLRQHQTGRFAMWWNGVFEGLSPSSYAVAQHRFELRQKARRQAQALIEEIPPSKLGDAINAHHALATTSDALHHTSKDPDSIRRIGIPKEVWASSTGLREIVDAEKYREYLDTASELADEDELRALGRSVNITDE